MTYFQTYDLKNKWAGVSSLYHASNFEKVNSKWGAKINEIKTFIGKLPKVSNNESIGHLKDSLSKYFDLSVIKMTAEQKKISKLIDEVKKLETLNEKPLSYIYFRNDGELTDETLINILKNVMTF